MSSELEDTVSILTKHNADTELAKIIFYAFHPLRFLPITDLDRQARKAVDDSDFYSLGFACLLLGETEKARRYLQGALLGRTIYAGQNLAVLVLNNLDQIQQVVTASVDDFNQPRAKYGMTPF